MLRLAESLPTVWFRQSRYSGAAVAALLWIAIGIALPGSRLVDLLTAAAISALYVMSWAAFCGPALEASFGHTFFVGSVAYVTALLHTRVGIPAAASLLIAAPAGALLGFAVATLTFRHRGLYFSMATMALQLTLYRCLFLYSPLFGGEEGIFGIHTLAPTRVGAFALTGGTAIAAYAITKAYAASRACLLLYAVGRNERLAEAIGVPVARTRALALALSGALAAIGGALYVFTIGQANVELAGDRLSARIVLLGTLGGAQGPAGPTVAAVATYIADQSLSDLIPYTGLTISVFLLVLVIAVPRGLITARSRWTEPQSPSSNQRRRTMDPFELQDMRHAFGGVQALNDVSFTLLPGSVTGIIGPNGAGKTTLLRVLSGDIEPDAGVVRWGARSVREGVSARARHGLRKTFQHVEHFGDLTVREHLAASMVVHGTTPTVEGLQEFLRESGLLADLDEPLDRLSPAAARMVDLAMTIASRPGVVLLDEPFAGVSADQSSAISHAVRRLRECGATIIVVEHRLKELFALVNRVIVMDRGAVVADETPQRVFENPGVLAAYGSQQIAMDM